MDTGKATMAKEKYQPFFQVVDTYSLEGHLVLVSDRTDSGQARTNETIQVHTPLGGMPKLYKAGCVSFSRLPGSGEHPFCMAIKGVEPEEIPVGSRIWIEAREHQIEDLSRYRKTVKPPSPGVADVPLVQKGNMETV